MKTHRNFYINYINDVERRKGDFCCAKHNIILQNICKLFCKLICGIDRNMSGYSTGNKCRHKKIRFGNITNKTKKKVTYWDTYKSDVIIRGNRPKLPYDRPRFSNEYSIYNTPTFLRLNHESTLVRNRDTQVHQNFRKIQKHKNNSRSDKEFFDCNIALYLTAPDE